MKIGQSSIPIFTFAGTENQNSWIFLISRGAWIIWVFHIPQANTIFLALNLPTSVIISYKSSYFSSFWQTFVWEMYFVYVLTCAPKCFWAYSTKEMMQFSGNNTPAYASYTPTMSSLPCKSKFGLIVCISFEFSTLMGTFFSFATCKHDLTKSESGFPMNKPPVCLKMGLVLILASSPKDS